MKRRIGRTTAALVFGAVGVLALASVGYANLLGGAGGTGTAELADPHGLRISAATPRDSALYPGGSADLAAQVVNPNPVPVRVSGFVLDRSASHPSGIATSDHGCPGSSVTFNGPARNGGGDFVFAPGASTLVLHDALSMSSTAPDACQGATFGVFLRTESAAGAAIPRAMAGAASSPQAPPAPVLDTPLPPAQTSDPTVALLFHDTDRGASIQCSLDSSGGWQSCASGQQFHVSEAGTHTLCVRAVDGRTSGSTCFTWEYQCPTKFGISGKAGPLWPGATQPVDLVLTNPNAAAITVTGVTTLLLATSNPLHCPVAGNFQVARQLAAIVVVPAHSTRSLSALGVPPASWPAVVMLDRPADQRACVGQTVLLGYVGSAH